MIPRRTVLCLGLSQLVCWGVTYYLIGVFGDAIAADLGWSRSLVHGGFSVALLVMALASPPTGWLIDRHGGRTVMVAGSVLAALGLARDPVTYYAAWLGLGVAMRLTLYDAAFASLARIGGPLARRPIAQITLLGGLASTAFWPLGQALAAAFGWRGAVFAYAGFALATIPLHLAIPGRRHASTAPVAAAERAPGRGGRSVLAAGLYAAMVALTAFLASGMSAHMIGVLAGLGVAISVAVWISALRGVGQSGARLAEVLFGARVPPLDLNLAAMAVLPAGFLAALLGGRSIAAAIVFAVLYGAGNGIATITRGTMPLVLFDARTYGALVGGLLVPSFLFSAVAPLAYAWVIERFGAAGALQLSLAVSGLAFGLAVVLRFGCQPPGSR